MTDRHPDWSKGYFENTIGSCADDPIERPAQCVRCGDGLKRDGPKAEAKTETITPIEYVQGHYHKRTDIVVWHGDRVVSDVYWYDEGTYTRKGYSVAYRWGEMRCHVDKYEHCLRVESSGPDYLRLQLRAIVERIDDKDLLESLEEMRQLHGWEG